MKKRIAAAALGLCFIPVSCFGAVSGIDSDYITEVTTVTITGTAEKGDFIGYSVTEKESDASDPASVVAAGDITVAEDDGSFAIKISMSENTPTGDYTVRIGWAGGDRTITKDIHFLNVSNTVSVIKGATELSELEAVFAPQSGHSEALKQLGYDMEALNSTLSAAGKEKVLTAFLSDEERAAADATGQAEIFGRYLGLEMINEDAEGGIEKVNPSFSDEEKYNDLTDASLKKYLKEEIGERADYDTLEELYDVYEELNIMHKINNASTGEFAELIDKYKSELGIDTSKYYKTFDSMTSVMKNRTANAYIKATENEAANSYDKFRELFEDAVDKSTDEKESPSNNRGGGGGGGYTGGVTSVTAKAEAEQIKEPEKADAFEDIAGVPWAKEAIESLAAMNIINGTGYGKFEPDSFVTREQLVKMIILSMGKEALKNEQPFNDVEEDMWYTPYVAEGYELGIINGISESEFGTGLNITRQDLTVIAVRAAELGGRVINGDKSADFNDEDDIADYAKEAVDKLYSAGIINGKDGNVFAPEDYCTRAEAAKIIYNVFFGQEV